jgi:hypothetical protein
MVGGFGTTFANDLIKLIFQATAIANLADNATSSPFTLLYLGLHTASPSGANQNTNEAAYGSYTRVSVARTSGGFTAATNTCALVALTSFPQASSGTETETHFSVGVGASAGTKLLFWGTITPNISVAIGVTPQITTAAFLTLGT